MIPESHFKAQHCWHQALRFDVCRMKISLGCKNDEIVETSSRWAEPSSTIHVIHLAWFPRVVVISIMRKANKSILILCSTGQTVCLLHRWLYCIGYVFDCFRNEYVVLLVLWNQVHLLFHNYLIRKGPPVSFSYVVPSCSTSSLQSLPGVSFQAPGLYWIIQVISKPNLQSTMECIAQNTSSLLPYALWNF